MSHIPSTILYHQDDPEKTAALFSGDFYITGLRVTSRSSLRLKKDRIGNIWSIFGPAISTLHDLTIIQDQKKFWS